MDPKIRVEDSRLRIAFSGADGPTIEMSIDHWRVLNNAVETAISVNCDASDHCPAVSQTARAPADSAIASADLSPDALDIVRMLTRGEHAVEPLQLLADRSRALRAGMYAWWGDDEACAAFGEVLGSQLPHLLYVGQAGATRSRSGTASAASLASRVCGQHIRGNAQSSTFRFTISSLLADHLSLDIATGGRLELASNARLSAWIADHLRIVLAPFDDRNILGDLEKQVVGYLDPPLNLEHCRPSETRARISKLRRELFREADTES